MPAYLLARLRISDPEQFGKYRQAVPAVIARFGGRYVIRGGEAEVMEGTHDGRRLVVIEFPTLEAARGFWHSQDYGEVQKLREGAAEADVVLVPGVDPSA